MEDPFKLLIEPAGRCLGWPRLRGSPCGQDGASALHRWCISWSSIQKLCSTILSIFKKITLFHILKYQSVRPYSWSRPGCVIKVTNLIYWEVESDRAQIWLQKFLRKFLHLRTLPHLTIYLLLQFNVQSQVKVHFPIDLQIIGRSVTKVENIGFSFMLQESHQLESQNILFLFVKYFWTFIRDGLIGI